MKRFYSIYIAAGLVLLMTSIIGSSAATGIEPDSATYLSRMGYYVYYDDASWTQLQAQIQHLDIVAPYFYHLTPAGTIKTVDSRHAEVTAFVKSHNKKVMPIIQNEPKWDDFRRTIGSPDQQQEIVSRLLQVVVDAGYDGIQIDFEAVNAEDEDLLTAFMTRLSSEFRTRGLIVSQAVIARVSDQPSTWGGAYDYARLAGLNDFMTVMAYDYSSTSSKTPGPVAPYWWVKQVVAYALTKIPRSQIYLGVPFYGHDWNLDDGPPATSVTYLQAENLSKLQGAVGGFSKDEGAPWIRYQDAGGKHHEVWYENSQSLESKLNLALDNELGGFAAWRIGQEDPDDWQVIGDLESPATPVSPGPDSATSRYFPETGHWLKDAFLNYWQANGGLERLGYPRTEAFIEFDPVQNQSYLVQYCERARLEYHPEFADTKDEILLGHVGRWSLAQHGIDPWTTGVDPQSGVRYFPETRHTLAGDFSAYWDANGGLARFGYPISEELVETSAEDGQTYTVQYFERARMEIHADASTGGTLVLLGLLGNEMLRNRGWIN